MSIRRAGVVVCSALLVAGGALFACVGDTSVNPSTPSEDSSTPQNANDGSTSPGIDATATDAGSPSNDGSVGAGDGGVDAAPSACALYCASLLNNCNSETPDLDQQDTIPDQATCVAMCATWTATANTGNGIPCRAKYLEAGDCYAAGPWAVDFNVEPDPQCTTNPPCDEICAAATPKCASVDASFDCTTVCNNAESAGTPAQDCMEQATLNMYSDASATKAECAAIVKCPSTI